MSFNKNNDITTKEVFAEIWACMDLELTHEIASEIRRILNGWI